MRATRWPTSLHRCCVAGEVDRNAPAPTMRRMSEKLRDARYVELPGTGHLAPLECPKAFEAALRDFLKQTETTPPQEGAGR